jgi:hypothetical protein
MHIQWFILYIFYHGMCVDKGSYFRLSFIMAVVDLEGYFRLFYSGRDGYSFKK